MMPGADGVGEEQRDAAERYEALVRRPADAQELWGLRSAEGWLLLGDGGEQEAFPVWPREIFAGRYAASNKCEEVPEKIELNVFLAEMLPQLSEDGVLVAVFPVASNPGIVVNASDLRAHLELEQSNE